MSVQYDNSYYYYLHDYCYNSALVCHKKFSISNVELFVELNVIIRGRLWLLCCLPLAFAAQLLT